MIGPHVPACKFPWTLYYRGWTCRCAADREFWDGWELHGQRMRLAPLPAGMRAHDADDTGGIVYWDDGTRTTWHRVALRQSAPDWPPWSV